MTLDAIIFDFDGVLVETMDIKTQAFCALYRQYGDEIVEKVKDYHLSHGGVSRYDKFRYFSKELLGREITDEEVNVLANQFSALVEDTVVKASWVDGALEFIEKHHTQFPLYVVSATPTEELVRIISRRKMSHYFHNIYGSPAKKGSSIRKILLQNRYAKSGVFMIGDALADYLGAKDVGVKFIGRVPNGNENIFPSDVQIISDIFGLESAIFS